MRRIRRAADAAQTGGGPMLAPGIFLSLAGADGRRVAPRRSGAPGGSLVTTVRLPIADVEVPRAPRGDVGCVFNGTVLESVVEGTPAAQAGLHHMCGRTVSHVNGQPVMTLADIYSAAARDLSLLRLRFAAQVVVAPGSPRSSSGGPLTPPPADWAAPPQQRRPAPGAACGSIPHLRPLPSPRGDELVVDKQAGGPLGLRLEDMEVAEEAPGSPASVRGAGAFAGQRLTHVDGQPVNSIDEVREACTPRGRVRLRFAPGSPRSQRTASRPPRGEPSPPPAECCSAGAAGLLPACEVRIATRPGQPLGCKLSDMILTAVSEGSAAAASAAAACVGMRLTRIDATPVDSVDAVAAAMQRRPPRDGVVRLRFEPLAPAARTAAAAAAEAWRRSAQIEKEVLLGAEVALGEEAAAEAGLPQGTRGTVRGHQLRQRALPSGELLTPDVLAVVELYRPKRTLYVRQSQLVLLRQGASSVPRAREPPAAPPTARTAPCP